MVIGKSTYRFRQQWVDDGNGSKRPRAAPPPIAADLREICFPFTTGSKRCINSSNTSPVDPWNKGRIIGQKPPLKPQEVWAIRARLQLKASIRDLALFNIAIDSKLRGCDVVKLKVSDVAPGGKCQRRAQVIQQKTNRPVQFEITQQTRRSIDQWITEAELESSGLPIP